MNNKTRRSSLLASVIGAIAGFVGVAGSTAVADSLDEIAIPVSNPVNFEDPRIYSEIRPVYVYHKLDKKFITNGGDVRIYALQARIALTEDLAFIATKDGFVDMNPRAVLNDESGFANVAGGFKYAFYKNSDCGAIATAGLRYEAAVGEHEVLQGYGDGMINPFVSTAVALEGFNVIGGTGFRFAIDDEDSSFYDLDLHIDKKIGWFSPLIEFNLVHVLDAGKRLPIADEGQDFFNFGATESDGKTMVTAAVGGRAALSKDVSLGVAYQFPLAHGSGTRVTDWRITTDLSIKFDSFLS